MLLTHSRFLTKQTLVKSGSNGSPATLCNNTPMRGMKNQRRSQIAANPTSRFFATATAAAADATAPKMFCYQCEQTLDKKGCTTVGVCGKTPEVAALQDLLIYNLKGLSFYAHKLREVGRQAAASGSPLTTAETEDVDANRFTLLAVFSTLTNVNFDAARMISEIVETKKLTERLKTKYQQACKKLNLTPEKCPIPLEPYNAAAADPSATISTEMWVAKGEKVGLLSRFKEVGDEAVVGVQEMLVYGLKGVCAYADHALMNSREHPEIYSFVHEAFAFLIGPEANNVGRLLDMLMECGRVNLLTMQKLYEANTTYGKQSPAKVPIKPVPGKCILVSGHELKFLEELLKQTEGTGVNVYTHGEMLPAHAYPGLRKYKHLVGHFGLAWQRQNIDFGHFPGAILMTTNCLTPPKPKYKSKIFTAGAVGWANIPHVDGTDFAPVIKKALELPGFTANDTEFTYPEGEGGVKKVPSFEVGYGHDVVLSVAGTVLEAVKAGQIDRFYVIGGCDGSEGERSYYTELAQKLPPTSVVLTAGCGKYRLNQLDFKTIGDTGIPRLLDLGQCNDSYSAVQIAVALAKALNCGVNDLPLSIVLSWFEQKAVAVLLSLLSLGIKGIRIGPRLPAFIKPSVLQVLSEKFDLKLVGEAESDLKQMLGKV